MRSHSSRSIDGCRYVVVALALIASLASADDKKPYVDMTRVQVVAHQLTVRSSGRPSAWWPGAYFRVCGPLPEGTLVYCQYSKPDGAKWIRFEYDCTNGLDTDEYAEFDGVSDNGTIQLDSSEGNEPEERAVSDVGLYSLKIGYQSELDKTEGSLFNGRFEVTKRSADERTSRTVGKDLFLVNQDWRVPIGYLYYTHTRRPMFPLGQRSADPDFDYQMGLHCQLFLPECSDRGTEGLQAFLVHDGKRIPASLTLDSLTGGVNECRAFIFGSVIPFESRGTPLGEEPEKAQTEIENAIDALNEEATDTYRLARNPGEYTIKVLLDAHLIREIAFQVRPDGRIAGQGLVENGNTGSDKTVVPVRVLTGAGVAWDHEAYRTQAFWFNPLDGFALP